MAFVGRYLVNLIQWWLARSEPGEIQPPNEDFEAAISDGSPSDSVRTARHRARQRIARILPSSRRPVIGLSLILVLVGSSLLWNGLVTRTDTGVVSAGHSALSALTGNSTSSDRAQETGYSLFGSKGQTPQQLLDDYAQIQLRKRESTPDAAHLYYPLTTQTSSPVTYRPQPNLPETALGRFIAKLGVSPSTVNDGFRQGSAKVLQLFIIVGLLAVILGRRRWLQSVDSEWILAACGALVLLLLMTLIPSISLDYGVLRAFQQVLILLAPLVVIGSLTLLSPLGTRWAFRVGAALAIAFFVSLSGLMPQLTGGYAAQLNLNNSGLYYDVYYTQPQEIAAIQWLAGVTHAAPGREPVLQSDLLTYLRLRVYSPLGLTSEFYPALLRRDAYVLVGTPTSQRGVATVSYSGDILTYTYPLGLLERHKNLVYSGNGVQIFK